MYILKSERVKQGISQKDLAKRLNITQQHLCRIENEKSIPRKKLMIKIAKELDSDVMTLFFSNEK
ncbi:MAG: helix-turn-helix transcriptional regulator [Clostridium botulinum]|uniref:Transcriptional regulator n=1 Tax=Clostridium tepidum TaxID=1962263 RepID=A0A1S9I2K2_9CLOT|nr:helix-turn-helix transcriptional regulator [Clostridium tepidum]MDU6879049.1 helix-turn-helix transcriptional regulator [Clostridium botulinum]OOO64382.1 transcriptional regulator [Clostridium tepidum]